MLIIWKTKNVYFGLLFKKQLFTIIIIILTETKLSVNLILYFSEMSCQIVSM